MEEQFSQNDSNLRDSMSNNDVANKRKKTNNNLTGSKSTTNNEIIPERRRKYLNPGDEERGIQQTMPEQYEFDDAKATLKKNNKNNVQLQPLHHMPSARNSSVPPLGQNNNLNAGQGGKSGKSTGGNHPLQNAPSPNLARGGMRLESIDHT